MRQKKIQEAKSSSKSQSYIKILRETLFPKADGYKVWQTLETVSRTRLFHFTRAAHASAASAAPRACQESCPPATPLLTNRDHGQTRGQGG